MKKKILTIMVILLSISHLQFNVIAIEDKCYAFDELIIERNVELPNSEVESKFFEGLAVKEIRYETGEFIEMPWGEKLNIEESKFGFVDSNNNEVIPCIYDAVSGIDSHMNGVVSGSSTGIEFWSSFEYLVMEPGFREGVVCVEKGGKWGAIDKRGNVVIPFEFDELEAFNEGLAKARKGTDKYGFIDKQGNIVVPMIYDDADYFYNGYARVGQYNKDTGYHKYGFVDRQGNLVVPMIYDFVSDFYEDMAAVFNKTDEYLMGSYGYVNTKGELVVPMIYNDAKHFSNGLAPVAIPDDRFPRDKGQKLYGYIDKTGEMVIQPQYTDAEPFNEGLANVRVNSRTIVFADDPSELVTFDEPEKNGYIDIYGNEVIRLSENYSHEEDFMYGTAVVYKRDTKEYVRIKNPLAVSVLLNGNKIEFDQPPIIIDGRTLVPVRAVFESLGVNVEWIADTQTVLAQKDGRIVTLKIDSNVMKIGNEEILLDVPAQIINNRTLVPARAVAEAFECKVDWDGSTSTVIINDK